MAITTVPGTWSQAPRTAAGQEVTLATTAMPIATLGALLPAAVVPWDLRAHLGPSSRSPFGWTAA